MDYVQALEALTLTLSDMRQRIISLEAKVEHLDGDTPSHDDLVERIEALECHEWNDSWDDNVRDAVGCMTFSVTVD